MNPHFVIAAGQFEIADESSPQEVAGRIRRFAYEPVAFWTPRVFIEWCLSLFGRQAFAACASQSEAVTVAVGFSPRGGSPQTGRRGATLEGIDCLFGSGVAPRRAPFPHHYSVGSSPRLPSRSRSATSQKWRYGCHRVLIRSLLAERH